MLFAKMLQVLFLSSCLAALCSDVASSAIGPFSRSCFPLHFDISFLFTFVTAFALHCVSLLNSFSLLSLCLQIPLLLLLLAFAWFVFHWCWFFTWRPLSLHAFHSLLDAFLFCSLGMNFLLLSLAFGFFSFLFVLLFLPFLSVPCRLARPFPVTLPSLP